METTIFSDKSEFISIYLTDKGKVAFYINSSDQRDFTEDIQSIVADSTKTVTKNDVIEELDIAVLVSKQETIKGLKHALSLIEGWSKNGK